MSNLYKALLKAQKDMGAVKKDAKNPFFKSNFASLNSVRETVMPVLNENGIVLTQPTVVVDGKQYVETRLTHAESGESTASTTEVISKNAGDAQQAGSGISYARRYSLMSLLCLAAEDDDGNLASGKASTSPKASTSNLDASMQKLSEASKKVDAVFTSPDEPPAKTTGKFPRPAKTENKPTGDLF